MQCMMRMEPRPSFSPSVLDRGKDTSRALIALHLSRRLPFKSEVGPLFLHDEIQDPVIQQQLSPFGLKGSTSQLFPHFKHSTSAAGTSCHSSCRISQRRKIAQVFPLHIARLPGLFSMRRFSRARRFCVASNSWSSSRADSRRTVDGQNSPGGSEVRNIYQSRGALAAPGSQIIREDRLPVCQL